MTLRSEAGVVAQSGEQPKVATLGGPGTFAHQASIRILELYPELRPDLLYRPSVDGLWAGLEAGEVDLIVLSEQTSLVGWADTDSRLAPPHSGIYVHSATTVPYRCSLYAKQGTRLSDLDGIYGHGSIHQCRPWLDANLPGVPTLVHEQNSVAAASEVAAGDGRKAVVATVLTGEIAGLVPLATDIDGGASGSWWALARRPFFVDEPDRLIVTLRAGGDGDLGAVVGALGDAGFNLLTAFSQATQRRLFEYDYVMAFAGRALLAEVEDALRVHTGARLAAAYGLRG